MSYSCFLQWVPEITYHKNGTPFLLVGTKMDLRNDPEVIEKLRKRNQIPITSDQGKVLAEDLGAIKYLECSALSEVGTII